MMPGIAWQWHVSACVGIMWHQYQYVRVGTKYVLYMSRVREREMAIEEEREREGYEMWL